MAAKKRKVTQRATPPKKKNATKKARPKPARAKDILISMYGENYIAYLTGLTFPQVPEVKLPEDYDMRVMSALKPWNNPPCSCKGCPFEDGQTCMAFNMPIRTVPICRKRDWILWSFLDFDELVTTCVTGGELYSEDELNYILFSALNLIIECVVPLIGFHEPFTHAERFDFDLLQGTALYPMYEQAMDYGPASASRGVVGSGQKLETLTNGS